MPNSTFIKGITLLSSACLVGLFLVYKAGKLDGYIYSSQPGLQNSPNGGPLQTNKAESSKRVKDSIAREMALMPSSKSGPIFTPEPDSAALRKKGVERMADSATRARRDRMIGSSKSGIIFTPKPDTANETKK